MTFSSQPAAADTGTQRDESEASFCWECSAPVQNSDLFCGVCGRIQSLSWNISYFEVFGLQRKLRLDTAALEREFYRLSRRLHPDVYARASQQEQEWSLASSSLLNDAYRALKDPIRRTEYLLRLEGILSADEGGARKEDRVPADLLEEVFELNMQLDEMRMNRQIGEDDPQLQKDLFGAKANFDDQLKSTDTALEGLWDKWDAALDAEDEQQKSAIKEAVVALLDRRRYVRNLVNSVDEALQG